MKYLAARLVPVVLAFSATACDLAPKSSYPSLEEALAEQSNTAAVQSVSITAAPVEKTPEFDLAGDRKVQGVFHSHVKAYFQQKHVPQAAIADVLRTDPQDDIDNQMFDAASAMGRHIARQSGDARRYSKADNDRIAALFGARVLIAYYPERSSEAATHLLPFVDMRRLNVSDTNGFNNFDETYAWSVRMNKALNAPPQAPELSTGNNIPDTGSISQDEAVPFGTALSMATSGYPSPVPMR